MYHIGDTYFLDSAYGESKKKKDTSELIYKTETDSGLENKLS